MNDSNKPKRLISTPPFEMRVSTERLEVAFIKVRELSVSAVARAFRIPPDKLVGLPKPQ